MLETTGPVYSITPFTLLDYPEHVACILWFAGCNMRCGYCHNPQIVKARGSMNEDMLLRFLEKRRGLLDAVVLSGGEATFYKSLPVLARSIKSLGYKIKLDTNGTRPEIINQMLGDNVLDYVAIDFKAPATKFQSVTGIKKYDDFSRAIDTLIAQKNVPFEIRTTVHTSLLEEDDINVIIDDLDTRGYNGTYYIQNFRDNPTLGKLGKQEQSLNLEALHIPKNFTLAYRNF